MLSSTVYQVEAGWMVVWSVDCHHEGQRVFQTESDAVSYAGSLSRLWS